MRLLRLAKLSLTKLVEAPPRKVVGPVAPPGFVMLVGQDGAQLLGSDGAPLYGVA